MSPNESYRTIAEKAVNPVHYPSHAHGRRFCEGCPDCSSGWSLMHDV